MTRWLDDVFFGPGPEDDPPEDADEWSSQLGELERAVAALSEKLRAEPDLRRDEARLLVKLLSDVPGILFRSIIWPAARKRAGLPAHGKGGRPRKKLAAETGRNIS